MPSAELLQDSDDEASERDFLDAEAWQYTLALVIKTREMPDMHKLHELGSGASKRFSSLTVHVPVIGLQQGYCFGEIDTGNVSEFIAGCVG